VQSVADASYGRGRPLLSVQNRTTALGVTVKSCSIRYQGAVRPYREIIVVRDRLRWVGDGLRLDWFFEESDHRIARSRRSRRLRGDSFPRGTRRVLRFRFLPKRN